MSMGVYVTGDTHGDCTRIIEYARSHFLDAHDTVIVAGDFGCVWKGSPEENRRLDHLSESLDCRLAFVSGNHENFDILNNKSFYPHEIWSGGHVQHIRKNITHLLRGEMFCIDGKRILPLVVPEVQTSATDCCRKRIPKSCWKRFWLLKRRKKNVPYCTS